MMIALVRKDFLLLKEDFGKNLSQLFLALFILCLNANNQFDFIYPVLLAAPGWNYLIVINERDKKNHCIGLLIAATYSRFKIILSRYLSLILFIPAATAAYYLLTLFLAPAGFIPAFSLNKILEGIYIYTIFISISVPLYFCLGDTVIKVFGMILFFGLVLTSAFTDFLNPVITFLASISQAGTSPLWSSLAACGAFVLISFLCSCMLIRKQEY